MKYRIAVVFLLGASASLVALHMAGVYINTSKSIPKGLYWASGASAVKGDYVLWCPPKSEVFDAAKARGYIGAGPCKGSYGYMMKKILAAKGDVVSIGEEGVAVNGVRLANSRPMSTDGAGRPMPKFRMPPRALGASEVLLMSPTSGTSFDARYFGVIERAHIKSVISPLVIW